MLRHVPSTALIAGYDFSTGAVKALAFDVDGTVVAEVKLPTDMWTKDGVFELNAMQLEGQVRASTRALANRLRELGRLNDWLAGGISATHHTAGRIDADHNPIRRLIGWADQTLAEYHAEGLARLGGPAKVQDLIGGPWAVRYSLSHLVKDEHTQSADDWARTRWMLLHGPLAAGYLTGRFDCTSVSSAASTGIMDLRTNQWCEAMLGALRDPRHRKQAWANLPTIIGMNEPIGPLAENIAMEAGLPAGVRPWIFPTLDDQAAGLIGGGAVDAGQVAIILGNSAVVNSSAVNPPTTDILDAMKLNWGPYLWMRCYSNGAQFVDHIVGANPDWNSLTTVASAVPAGCAGVSVLPFLHSEPSVGVTKPRMDWTPQEPASPGVRLRAAYEAVAYLIGLAVQAHENAGQKIARITVSGGMAKSELMCEILASVLNRPLERLVSDEGSALGGAVVALAGLETLLRKKAGDTEPFTAADAVRAMVKFKSPVKPRAEWVPVYKAGLARFMK